MANPVRTCLACGQTDDHPRHVVGLPDGNDVNYHFDCCAIVKGCETCTPTVDSAGGKKGDDLRAHIVENAPVLEEAE
jgi:hypothetical protein